MRDRGLDYLLDLDGEIMAVDANHYVKFEAKLVEVTTYRPHGIKYSLTLHDQYGTRLLGFDNAHAVRPPKKGYRGKQIEYDHTHKGCQDKGTPYTFGTPDQLVSDFWEAVSDYTGIAL